LTPAQDADTHALRADTPAQYADTPAQSADEALLNRKPKRKLNEKPSVSFFDEQTAPPFAKPGMRFILFVIVNPFLIAPGLANGITLKTVSLLQVVGSCLYDATSVYLLASPIAFALTICNGRLTTRMPTCDGTLTQCCR